MDQQKAPPGSEQKKLPNLISIAPINHAGAALPSLHCRRRPHHVTGVTRTGHSNSSMTDQYNGVAENDRSVPPKKFTTGVILSDADTGQ